MSDIETLARYFRALVSATFDSETLAEIDARNALPRYTGCCATHDFCDANSLMYGAFCALMFREPNTESDSDCALWNAAWDAARKTPFAA